MSSLLKTAASTLMLVLGCANGVRGLTLDEAEALALAYEPGIEARLSRASALREEAVAAGERPDPMLQLGALNLPVDSFDLDQEPMTQLRVGISQQFPQGDTLALRRAIMDAQGDAAQASAAERHYRRALDLDPGFVQARDNLAELHNERGAERARAGDLAGARELFARYLELRDEGETADEVRAWLAERAGAE